MTCVGKLQHIVLVAALMLVGDAATAQQTDEFRSGYAQGYRDGFDAGFAKAQSGAPLSGAMPSKGFPIAVTTATYAAEDSDGRCDATRYVRNAANGRRSVSVDINNRMCGDPAPGKRKSVEITYLCGAVAKTASAYEHRQAYLSCD